MRKVILLTGESLGYGDPVIGYEALSALVDILVRRKEKLPIAIVCLNTAVQILAEDSPLLPRLKVLEGKGVDILAGQMCVNECGLTNKIAVGTVTSLTEIMDLMLEDDVDIMTF